MELFDAIIRETTEKTEKIKTKSWGYNPDDTWETTDRSELIMQRDQAFELGGSGCSSANFTCVTTSENLVGTDEIVLCGKDLDELDGDVSFARVVLLGVKDIGDEDAAHTAIQQMEFVRYHVHPKGYMVRVSAETAEERVRVSKESLTKGINFEKIGNTYIDAYRKNENVLSVRIIFITDNEIIKELSSTAGKVSEITNALSHILDGIDLDCAHCDLKPVCDSVEGMREMHLGKKR